MALTRKFLSALGIESDKVDEIINAHAETVDALKGERDSFKENAEKYDAEHKRVGELEKEVEGLKESSGDSYKEKYQTLKTEFDDYKKGIESEKTKATKTTAYKGLLKEIGISDDAIEDIIEVSASKIEGIKLDKDGKIEGSDELKQSLETKWARFKVKESTKGANTHTPPAGSGKGVMSRDEIAKIKDTQERQKAYGEWILAQQKG